MAWLYSLTRDGRILVREGFVTRIKVKGSKLATFHISTPNRPSTQRVLVHHSAGKIYNDVMWSESKDQLTRYYEKMNETLLARENQARHRLSVAIERRQVMRYWYDRLKGGGI